jgi:4-amino-4-deoxy-L-arabinose transferase-like glycosyltransferase
MSFKNFIGKFKLDIVLVFLLLCLSPLFFYKLGQSSLISWDEAWYAGIARNMLNSGDIFNLWWNGAPFFDHPPAGFWWMALSFKLFGISNLTAKLPSAVFGLGTLIAVYFLGRDLFGKWVGFASALALTSAPWFLYRARSGNLDIFLTFFFVLTILLAVKAVKNAKYFIPLGLSLAILFLTKTLVPVTVLPALVIVFIGKKIQIKQAFLALLAFFIPVYAWYRSQISVDPTFLDRYFYIGLPGVKAKPIYAENFKIAKNYLHDGIAKWFWPSSFSVFANLLLLKRSFYIISVMAISFFVPFLFSNRTQIWHLIPIFPFMILAFFAFGYFAAEKITRKKALAIAAVLSVAFYFSFMQIKAEWNQFINIPAYISDEEILSKEAAKYPDKLYIDSDFIPAAIFYSGKDVKQTYVGGIAEIFKTQENFLLIATKNRISDEGISPEEYEIIKSDRDKILIRKI